MRETCACLDYDVFECDGQAEVNAFQVALPWPGSAHRLYTILLCPYAI